MKKNASRAPGFTLVEIMIVVAIIGILAAIAIPNFIRSRATAQASACINNLRQIDSAVQQWAMEKGQHANDPAPSLTTDLTPYIKLNANNEIPNCPGGGGNYIINPIGHTPQVECPLGNTVTPAHVL